MRYLKDNNNGSSNPPEQELVSQPLSLNLQENQKNLEILLKECSDAVLRSFSFGYNKKTNCLLLYFDGLVDRQEIETNLLKPMLLELNIAQQKKSELATEGLLQEVQNEIIAMADVKTLKTIQEVLHHISSGDAVLLLDGYNTGLVAGTRSWQTRGIQRPENEPNIQGPKEGFSETLRFNTALLRRRLKSTNFKIESMILGKITKTDVVICYINNIAGKDLINEVKKRLSRIEIDGVLDSGYLEEFIEDTSLTIFSQVEYTEKPDRVVGHLLEGRVCIMVDGSPMALIVPTTFPQYINSGEDYYQRFIPATLFRILRYFAFTFALTLPSMYVAITTYHQEMIPPPLYLTIAASREGVPFPALVEALLLEATFELLREASLRLPGAIGPAISIMGALIIGDAAVKAGLVSTPMVVVIAFTGIASFATPSYNAGIIVRMLRFLVLLAASVLGFFGIIITILLILIRMASLESFGTPYLSPLSPINRAQMSDTFIRRPWYNNRIRPYMPGMENQIRQNNTSNDNGG